MQAAVLMVLLVGGAFSYYQLGSPLFGCGTVLAGSEIYLWMALCAVQSLLFLAGALSRPARRVYRVLQYLTLPLAAIPLAQIAATDARIFACVAVAAIAYWYVVARRRSPASPHPAGGASRDIGSSITETAAFLLAMLVIHSAFAFLVLHTPGMALDDRRFVLIGAASAALAAALVRFDRPLAPLSIAEVPPIALLVVVLLRAKLPDGAYDSLFYKATVPIMIADWRTAITGALDHTLLGTDFLEIVNSQLRIADPRYSPALTGSFAFLGMWAIVPAAARSVIPAWTGGAHGLARNVLALLLVSMTGPLVAAGTAYQEPMLSLLMAAALLPLSLAWVFLAAAVAVKVTAGFIAPLIVLARCWPLRALWRQDRLDAQDGGRSSTAAFVARVAGELRASMRSRALLLAICLVLAAVTFGEQFYRNLAYTGRLTGLTETFVGLTDPDGHVLALEKDDPAEALVPHGFRQRYANTFIHVLTLDRWIKTTEFGFHVIPSSRLPAIAAVLCLLVLAFPALRRNRPLLCSFALWLLCSVVLLHFVSQGRYLLPASLGAALVIAYLLGTAMQAAEASGRGRILGAAIALVVAFVAVGDQLVGSFINDGWVCRRDLFAPVVKNNYDRPETAIEARLLDLAARQRSASPSRSVIPTILCENTVDRMRYVGAHYEFAQYSLALNLRRLAAHPSDARLLPTTLLAVCFTSDAFVGEILPPDVRKDFVEMEPVKTDAAGLVRILASRPLLTGARPTTLVGDRFDPLGWLRSSASVAAGPRRLGLASARREDRQAAR